MALDKTVRVRITADTTGFSRGVATANTQLSTLGATTGRIMRTMSAFAALFAARAFISGIGESVKAFASFEQGLANIAILLDEDIDRLGEWEEAIDSTATTLGLATGDLLKAGFDIQSATNDTTLSLKLFREAAELARAGGSSVADTVKGALTLNEAYAKSFKGVGDMMDFLIVAQKKARATIGELSVSSSKFIGVAASLGIKVEELFAVFAQLTRGFGNSKEAATALSAIMNSLQKPSQKMIDLSQDMFGMSIQRAIAEHGLVKVLHALKTVTKENIGTTLGRIRANRAFAIVQDKMNVVEQSTIELQERAGAKQGKLALQMANNQVKLDILTESWVSFKRVVGAIVSDTNVIPFFTELANELRETAKAYKELKDAASESVGIVEKSSKIIGDILLTMGMPKQALVGMGFQTGQNFIEGLWKSIREGLPINLEKIVVKAGDGGAEGETTSGPDTTAEDLAFETSLANWIVYEDQKIGIKAAGFERLKEITTEFASANKAVSDFERAAFISKQEQELDAVIARIGKEKAAEEGLFAVKQQLSRTHNQLILAGTATTLGAMSSVLGALSTSLNAAAAENKKFAAAAKAVAIAMAIINTAQAMTKAMADWGMPWGLVAAGIIGAAGAIQVGVIAAQGMQKGGIVPGSGRGDIVPTMLEPGELVVPRDAVSSVVNNSSSPVINISMAGAMVMDSPTHVQKLYREYLRDVIRDDIETGRDNFYG